MVPIVWNSPSISYNIHSLQAQVLNAKEGGPLLITRYQVPCTPALAITVNKAPGRSYDRIALDLQMKGSIPSESDNFQPVYVALSHVRTLDGMTILRRPTTDILNARPGTDIVNNSSHFVDLEAKTMLAVSEWLAEDNAAQHCRLAAAILAWIPYVFQGIRQNKTPETLCSATITRLEPGFPHFVLAESNLQQGVLEGANRRLLKFPFPNRRPGNLIENFSPDVLDYPPPDDGIDSDDDFFPLGDNEEGDSDGSSSSLPLRLPQNPPIRQPSPPMEEGPPRPTPRDIRPSFFLDNIIISTGFTTIDEWLDSLKIPQSTIKQEELDIKKEPPSPASISLGHHFSLGHKHLQEIEDKHKYSLTTDSPEDDNGDDTKSAAQSDSKITEGTHQMKEGTFSRRQVVQMMPAKPAREIRVSTSMQHPEKDQEGRKDECTQGSSYFISNPETNQPETGHTEGGIIVTGYLEDTPRSFKSRPGPKKRGCEGEDVTAKSKIPRLDPRYAGGDEEVSDEMSRIDEESQTDDIPQQRNSKHRGTKYNKDRHAERDRKASRKGHQQDEEEDSDGGPDPPSTDPEYEEDTEDGIGYGVDFSDDDIEADEHDEPIPSKRRRVAE
ncbi:hypothetical protein Dda_7042 [Drechslerella dactyloides]|uniref:Uncharacterized protein n=1 Tax=Drechslerella dactyloides TaxID=74499 RepID=A0AAD6NH99_DREDA|nr:hypothetical protein Dda_7042 [Drechslerella dactyloides]